MTYFPTAPSPDSPSVSEPSACSLHPPVPVQPMVAQSRPQPYSSPLDKQKIAANFGQAAAAYHAQAHLQRLCATTLLSYLNDASQPPLPDGPMWEIGCGTGFISQQLFEYVRQQPGQWPLHITDLSPEMVAFCQRHVTGASSGAWAGDLSGEASGEARSRLFFQVRDAESYVGVPNSYSLIIGGFVAQWFQQFEVSVERLLHQLQPGGRLLLSFPGHQSFPEWREMCDRLSLPFTAQPLPNPTRLIHSLQSSPHHCTLTEEWWPTTYPSPAAFFRSMKAIGAGWTQTRSLSPRQMRQLLKAWQDSVSTSTPPQSPQQNPSITVQYQIVYLSITKHHPPTNVDCG